MFGLDVRSVIVIAGIMSLMMSVALYFMKRNYPPSIEGLAEWATAPAILFVAALLFGSRDRIPDSLSIVVGDRVLVDFAERVRSLLRLPDRFGRFGGEEFVVLLPETPLDKARVVAERIRRDIEQANGNLPKRTVSIGVTVSFPDDPDLDGLLTRADAALYRAKNGGRNSVETVALSAS